MSKQIMEVEQSTEMEAKHTTIGMSPCMENMLCELRGIIVYRGSCREVSNNETY